ncbi:hypothetical protein K469DRAFT_673459 [Zopfia rhizophila CBS 207.26]|uniref:Uncharacterized protein n=1 Tax=Zopfia rhizophila CBS 207.26 TaxID=1314779 RepID=A0A6A6DPU3_9PEZI|nr:hypothetical protein K469DRAFT_673459 [Zopfia rhizophila CBS 207.26]
MPIDWRPDTPLKAFVEYSQTRQRDFPGGNRAKKYKRRVFNDKKTLAIPITRPNPSSKRTLYEIEGILEVQRMLLQKLAAQENVVKGLSGYELQSPTSTPKADLDRLKKDTGLAIQATWNRSSRK